MSGTTSQSRRRGAGGKAAILFLVAALAQAAPGSPVVNGVDPSLSVTGALQRVPTRLNANESARAPRQDLEGERAVRKGGARRDIPRGTLFIWKARRDASDSISGDSDADGLPDAWEHEWFGGLAESAGGDADADGVSNAEEHGIGTVPTLINVADLDGSLGLVVYGALR